MTITHQLKIERIDRNPEFDGKKNTVFSAYWRAFATNGKTTVSHSGFQILNTENIHNFTEYENLTEELVVSLVKDAMAKTKVSISEIYSMLDAEIEETEKPKETLQLVPWKLN